MNWRLDEFNLFMILLDLRVVSIG